MLYCIFHTFSMSKLISKNDFRDNCGFGLIAHINGKKSHDIVIKSINALESMTHRGAIGADGKTGDGCGILVDLDKDFFEEALLKEQSIKIKDEFAIGQIFLDHEIDLVLPKIKKILKKEININVEKIIFFRSVFNTIDMSLNGKKPPDEIKVNAKLKESKVLKPIISQVIKIKRVREK